MWNILVVKYLHETPKSSGLNLSYDFQLTVYLQNHLVWMVIKTWPSLRGEAVKVPLLVTVKTRLANTLEVLQTEEILPILKCPFFFTHLSLKYTKMHRFFEFILGMLFWRFPEVVTDKVSLELCWIILKEREKLTVLEAMAEMLKYLKTCLNVENHILIKDLLLQIQLSHWHCKANILRHSVGKDLLCGRKNIVFYITHFLSYFGQLTSLKYVMCQLKV